VLGAAAAEDLHASVTMGVPWTPTDRPMIDTRPTGATS
jgi:hypothetical protein